MHSPFVRSLITLCLLVLGAICASAQTPSTEPETFARIGLFGGMNLNIHSTSFDELTDVPNCCPEFLSGNGIGGAIGIVYEQSLGGAVEVALRAAWQSRGGTLESFETMPVIDKRTGNPIDGEIRHVIETGLSSITIEPLLSAGFGRIVRLHIGPHLGFMTSTTFEQREELTKPEEFGTFENNLRVRNDTNGTIPNAASFDAGITLGATFDIPLNRERTLIAAPEVFFTADLTNATTDLSWKNHTVRFGVALKYVLLRDAQSIAATPDPAVPAPAAKPASASIRAFAVASDGTERADVTMHIEEFVSINMRPLLNYVFFDDGSSELPARYLRTTPERFDRYGLHSLDAIGTYYHMLNVIGQRLREKPRARVTLTGCTAGAAIEPGGLALSHARAVAVRDYLRDAWAIDSSRIRIAARELPSVPSDSSTSDGRSENRRVEILVDDPDVLAPVVTVDTLRTVTPPFVRFRPSYESTSGARSWRVDAIHRGVSVTSFSGDGMPPQSIDWETNSDQLSIPSAGDSLEYLLRVDDADGGTVAATGAMPVNLITLRRKREERVGDRLIDRYSLILFDYDRADLDATNFKIGTEVRGRIAENATVTITGHTDRIGEEAYNQRLSEERARSVARVLGIAPERASGLGETRLLYDNALPEGRFYSRTVTIVVETPIQ